jgi:menaquinone-dependent protoporphyrinogen oxidase
MKILIAYTSKHGTTERIAGILNVKINGTAKLVNLSRGKKPDLKAFDIVIVGGSIYMGRINSTLRKYLAENQEILLTKHLGLYLSCLEKDETAQNQFNRAFPELLRNHSFATGLLGGEVLINKMNILERFIVSKTHNIKKSTTRLNNKGIDHFVKKIRELMVQ